MSIENNLKLHELLSTVEAKLRATSDIGSDKWFLVALVCIVASPDPPVASELYLYLVSQPMYQTSISRQSLVRRLREALIKVICLIGFCKPMEAILSISEAERLEDRDYTFTRQDWQCDEANLRRAVEWFNTIYMGNAMYPFDAHRDFEWILKNIVYGLCLSDRQVLDDLDTELVVLTAVMAQNLPRETWWHIRGVRRIGLSKDDTEMLCETIKLLMAHWSISLDRVPAVHDVEQDV